MVGLAKYVDIVSITVGEPFGGAHGLGFVGDVFFFLECTESKYLSQADQYSLRACHQELYPRTIQTIS